MSIPSDQVKHIARLARLALSPEEQDLFGSQLASILHYIEKLDELDTAAVEPTSHVLELLNVVREDEPRPSLPVDEALGNAPDRSGSFYRVPRIIE